MPKPLRLAHFAATYLLIAAALMVVPVSTVEGGPWQVEVRPGVSGDALELAFDDPAFADPQADPATTPTVPRRPSAAPVIEDRSDQSPSRISVPRLGIDGPVVPVGLAADRQLNVPFARTAGWYEHSSLPDDRGASVLAAHVDFDGQQGLFFDLRLAQVGDLVHIEGADGERRTYKVSDVVLYDKTDLPSEDLFRSNGEHALHLVTCGGTFDRLSRSYRGNQVVTALPVS